MKDFFFSVIIPTLNEEKFLPKILNSLKKQKQLNFEVVIVDGKSEDKTLQVADGFKPFLPLRMFGVEKRNVAYQRNYGAKMAKGRYLVFLDADSNVNPTFTGKLAKNILKIKGVLFLPYLVAAENSPQAKMIFKFVNFIIATSQNLGKPFSSGGSIIIEKSFFHLIEGFNEKLFLAEDHDLVRKAYNWGVKAKFLNQIRVEFSLRRMKKEGQLTFFYKSVISTAYFLINGKIEDKIYNYEMGGGHYNKTIKDNLHKYLDQVNTFFKKIFYE